MSISNEELIHLSRQTKYKLNYLAMLETIIKRIVSRYARWISGKYGHGRHTEALKKYDKRAGSYVKYFLNAENELCEFG